MMTIDEIRALLNDLESDRVERTISTTNTDKFGQAICAFANDLPDHRLPGYLFLGVDDDGKVTGINVTDDLLKNVAAIRTDGNIQPQPSMTVERSEKRSDLTIFGEKRSEKGSDMTIFDEKPSDLTENDEGKQKKVSIPDFPTMLTWNVYEAIKMNRKAKYSWLADNLGVSEATIKRAIADLKELGYINPEHSKVNGEWQLLK